MFYPVFGGFREFFAVRPHRPRAGNPVTVRKDDCGRREERMRPFSCPSASFPFHALARPADGRKSKKLPKTSKNFPPIFQNVQIREKSTVKQLLFTLLMRLKKSSKTPFLRISRGHFMTRRQCPENALRRDGKTGARTKKSDGHSGKGTPRPCHLQGGMETANPESFKMS